MKWTLGLAGALAALPIVGFAQGDFQGGTAPRRGGVNVQPGPGPGPFSGTVVRPQLFNNDINPLQNHTMEILQRPEVQSHIALTLKQKNLLNEMMNEADKQLQDQIRQNNQNPTVRNFRNLPPEQQQQAVLELRQANAAMMAQFQQWKGEIDDKVKKILRPEQVKRLYELDLQYRGPLSMADPRVAEAAKISNDHRSAVARAYGDYQAKVQELRQGAIQELRDSGTFAPNQPGDRRDRSQDIQAKMMPLQRKTDAARKEAEDAALALLSPEEKAGWTAAQGAPFTFRKDYGRRNGLLGN